ncbi:hypothetical protein [Tateyamaria omphalii]|uniref:Uncharacterized protein n=1 Tax=Tateyamaria omphalii TaxID=299262 RepID=A0A1P8N1V8_9RHOB|nr:hypothetical protein [Tateyamaria omphalii]APX14303.1 hypothetical protein BWR18_20880 [Tateyamaria omphalii]
MKRAIWSLLMSVSVAGMAAADAPQPVQQNNSNAIWFENWTGLSNTTMTIAKPDGEVVSIFAASGTPVFELVGRDVIDGVYRYEISAATEDRVEIKNVQNNGRGDAAQDTIAKAFYLTGAFHVERGVIVAPENLTEEE